MGLTDEVLFSGWSVNGPVRSFTLLKQPLLACLPFDVIPKNSLLSSHQMPLSVTLSTYHVTAIGKDERKYTNY